MEKGGFVYIMASRRNGTLYTGVTADHYRRVVQHRAGEGGAFTKRYAVKLLVWYERFDDIRAAIARETLEAGLEAQADRTGEPDMARLGRRHGPIAPSTRHAGLRRRCREGGSLEAIVNGQQAAARA